MPIWIPELKQAEEFECVSERGAKGFGSSGVQRHLRSSQGGFGKVSDILEIFLIGFGVYLLYRIATIFLKSKKTIHTSIYEMLTPATILMISIFVYKHQKTHILVAFLIMFFMSKLKQVQGSHEE